MRHGASVPLSIWALSVLAALAVLTFPAPAAAQPAPTAGVPPVGSLWGALGATVPLGRTGVDRSTGPGGMIALDQEVSGHVAFRFELSGGLQGLSAGSGTLLRGDLQQARVIAATRLTPATLGRYAPYALAGIGVTWQSEHIELRDAADPVPDVRFQQTISTTARVALLGAGIRVAGARFDLFGEARWTRAMLRDDTARDLDVVAGLSLPLPR